MTGRFDLYPDAFLEKSEKKSEKWSQTKKIIFVGFLIFLTHCVFSGPATLICTFLPFSGYNDPSVHYVFYS